MWCCTYKALFWHWGIAVLTRVTDLNTSSCFKHSWSLSLFHFIRLSGCVSSKNYIIKHIRNVVIWIKILWKQKGQDCGSIFPPESSPTTVIRSTQSLQICLHFVFGTQAAYGFQRMTASFRFYWIQASMVSKVTIEPLHKCCTTLWGMCSWASVWTHPRDEGVYLSKDSRVRAAWGEISGQHHWWEGTCVWACALPLQPFRHRGQRLSAHTT